MVNGRKAVEIVEPGTFRATLEKRKNVELMLNHTRKLGSVETGELTLTEDNIGLRAEADITDSEIIQKARNGELRGWSFGMYVQGEEIEERAEKLPCRRLKDIDMFEVSIIDKTRLPVYAGTSIEYRAEEESTVAETRTFEEETVETVNTVPPDLSEYEKRAYNAAVKPYEQRLSEIQ